MYQDELRQATRVLKAKERINYNTIASEVLNMNINSFYNWLSGYTRLTTKRYSDLKDFISNYIIEEGEYYE